MSKPNGAWRVFRTPLLLAVVSGAGLVAALLSEGAADAGWTLAAAFPVLVIGWALFRARGKVVRQPLAPAKARGQVSSISLSGGVWPTPRRAPLRR